MREVRRSLKFFTGAAFVAVLVWASFGNTAASQTVVGRTIKGQPIESLLSTGGRRVAIALDSSRRIRPAFEPADLGPEDGLVDPSDDPGPDPQRGDGRSGAVGGGAGANAFVNDPCLDPAAEAPFPENFRRTTQSETTVAVLNAVNDDGEDEADDEGNDNAGKLMVAGYNDSFGFYNNKQGLSGFSYSTDGGKSWIDGGGLPPKFPTGVPAGTPGSDAYFGDPVVVVHHKTKTFYYSSIYQNAAGVFTLSVNRGQFMVAAAQGVESNANTRCQGNPAKNGIPDPPAAIRKRIIWEPPVEAVPVAFLHGGGDFLDKEWLYVDQKTGFLYMTYTRFGADGSTPIELVRSFDGGHTWTAPSVIVPNLDDTFNQATQPVVTPTGRVIVTWNARTFPAPTFVEREQRIEVGISDNCQTAAPCSFGPPVIVARVNPQGEPPGYNRGRTQILNAPYIAVDKGRDDGVITGDEREQRGFGNVYITYFDGLTPLPRPTSGFLRAAEIHLSRSTNNGATWGAEVKVNDDNTQTSHVFPSVQVNKHGKVFVTWLDRRVDPINNALTDTWGVISKNLGVSFGKNVRISDVSADWFVRADARPNFGDYNSSTVINFTNFGSIWADGRFPPGTFVDRGRVRRKATPDSLFAVFKDGTGESDNQGANHD